MNRGKRLYKEDLMKMDGEKVLVYDDDYSGKDIIHTVELNHKDKFITEPFAALVEDGTTQYYDMDYEEFLETKAYQIIDDFEVTTRTRGFEFISEYQFNIDFVKAGLVFMKYEYLKLPKRATKKSAGYDCFAPVPFTLKPNEEIKLPTGIRSYMLDDEVLFAHVRSGHGFKYARLANATGVIDCDYYFTENEGHIWVKIRNEGSTDLVVADGEGMCQLIFQKYLLADGDNFEDGEERTGGFGSTTK